MRTAIICTAVLFGILGYLTYWPLPIEPEFWIPPTIQILGESQTLGQVSKFELSDGDAPHSIAIDAQHNLYTGLSDGRIMRIRPYGGEAMEFAQTGGRPLGMTFDQNGTLIVCDAIKGLLAINSMGIVTLLSSTFHGKPLGFINDLAIAKDSKIYFTQTSAKHPLKSAVLDIFEHKPNGRVLIYDPIENTTQLLWEGLYFPNGIALSQDENYVVVSETSQYRILRLWINSSKIGTKDILIDNLPGFPDGLSRNDQGQFWLSLFAPRQPLWDQLAMRPFLKKSFLRLPQRLQPQLRRSAHVIQFDGDGKILQNFENQGKIKFSMLTSAIEHRGLLYLGSFTESSLGVLKLHNPVMSSSGEEVPAQ